LRVRVRARSRSFVCAYARVTAFVLRVQLSSLARACECSEPVAIQHCSQGKVSGCHSSCATAQRPIYCKGLTYSHVYRFDSGRRKLANYLPQGA
jgi:hypothetical protein